GESGKGNSQRGVRAGGDWQRNLARGIPFGFPDSATAAETGGEPAGTRARQEQIAVSARGSLRGAVAAFLRHLLASEAKDVTAWRKPTRRSQSGTQSYTGTGEQRSQLLGDAEAECRCACLGSRHGRPVDRGRYWPDLANRHGT